MDFLRFLAQYRTPEGDILFQGITYLAQELFVVTVICWFFWCSDKKQAYSLGFSYFTSGLLVQGLKIIFRIPRPWVLDPNFQPVTSAVPGATGYSFPSGHTQSITALFSSLALRAKKTSMKILCFVIIGAVMFSRMYLGCHTPMDVLVSFFITLICVLLTNHFLYKKEFSSGHEGTIAVIMAAACIILCVYAVLLHSRNIITAAYAGDCLKASGAGIAFAAGFYIENRFIRFSPPTSARGKILRMIVGLIAAVCILEGLKQVIGTSLASSFVRYFLTVAWIIIGYPVLFQAAEKYVAVHR